jgi:hypothetical protein
MPTARFMQRHPLMFPFAQVAVPVLDLTLNFWAALALFIVPGAFGGILSVLQLIDVGRLIDGRKKILTVAGNRFWGAILVAGAGGVGGALASFM